MSEPGRPARLFLSYAHADNEHGDFAWVVAELSKRGVDVVFDERVVVVGRPLWPQIEKAISDPAVAAWGWLVTPKSIGSTACREELEYARLRALNRRGDEFPLIGLVDGVPAESLPLAIRARLYVDLRDPDWAGRVAAGVAGRVPSLPPRELANCHWRVHRNYRGDPEVVAIEVRPRFGSIPYFAIVSPMPGPVTVGTGPAGGGGVGGALFEVGEWENLDVFGDKSKVIAMRGPVDPSMSAYAVYRMALPAWVAFGPCDGPFVLPRGVDRFTP